MISKNKSIKTIILLGCLWLSLNAYLFPLIWHNGAGVGYVDPGPKQSISTNPIETLIVSAAGYYLDASSNIKQVLMQIELQDANGLNTTTLNSSLDSAIKNIQKAKELYGQLVTQAENSLYNPDVIKALSQFNYGDFCTKEALNTTVFAEVSLF